MVMTELDTGPDGAVNAAGYTGTDDQGPMTADEMRNGTVTAARSAVSALR